MDKAVLKNRPKLPKICMGLWEIGGYPFFKNINESYAEEVLETAIENNIVFFDTSPIYGLGKAEILLGRILNKSRRDEVIIATKGGLKWTEIINNKPKTFTNNSRKSLKEDLCGSLERLKTDYVDIFQLHWPEENPNTEIEAIVETMKEFQKEGLIKHFGVSNHGYSEISKYLKFGSIRTAQNRIDLGQLNEIKELKTLCSNNDIFLMGYGVLQNGLLTNTEIEKYRTSDEPIIRYHCNLINEKQILFAQEIRKLSSNIGISVAQLVVSYLLKFEIIDTAIIGTKNSRHAALLATLDSVNDIDILNRINNLIKKIL